MHAGRACGRALAGMHDETLTPQPLAQPLLTADDVATLLRVPRSSVYEYARRRTDPLPTLRIGRHLRFERAQLDGWLSAQRRTRG